jgi:hypothetical protein
MPKVPRQVAPTPLPVPQETAMAQPGMGIAASVAAVAGPMQQLLEDSRRKANQVRLNEAEVAARRLRSRILLDPDTGVLNRQRQAAFDAPEVVAGEWRKGVSDIAQGLNPDVREAFLARTLQLGAEMEEQAFRHVRKEMDVVDKETTDALVADEVERVSRSAFDPAVVSEAIANAQRLTTERLTRMDVAGPAKDKALADLTSAMRLLQVETLAESDPDRAEAVLADVQDAMTAKDRERAQKVVEGVGMAVRSQKATDDLWTEFGPDGEADALQAARSRFGGKMEDEVVGRVRDRYNEARRLEREGVDTLVTTAMREVESGQGLSAGTRAELLRRAPEKLQAIRLRERQVANGTAAVTDWDVFDRLVNMPNEEFKVLNLDEYRPSLSDSDYRAFTLRKAELTNTGGRGTRDRGLTQSQVWQETFALARETGVIGETVMNGSMLKKRETDEARFTQVWEEITGRLLSERELNNGVPPDTKRTREIIREVFDEQVLVDRTFLAIPVGTRAMPAAAVRPGESVRGPAIPQEGTRGERRNARYLELIEEGVPPVEAINRAIEEVP